MKLSKDGALKIFGREGLRLKPYRDSKGIWTYAIGAIYDVDGNRVTKNTKALTKPQAVALFNRQSIFYVSTVNSCISSQFIPQTSFDAFVSVCYNIGRGQFERSTFLKRFESGDIPGCAEAMAWFNKITVNGVKKVDNGLVNRRKGEIDQFLAGYADKPDSRTVELSGKFTGVIA